MGNGSLRRASRFFAVGAHLLFTPRADAQTCQSPRTPSVLSEARAARWLVGDDVHSNAQLDGHRGHVGALIRQHGVAPPFFDVYASGSFGYQAVYGFPACVSTGDGIATMERMRVFAAAGLSHAATGLSFRASFVHAQDQLAANVAQPGGKPDSDGDVESEDATAGFRQQLAAVRVGHARWGRLVLGYVWREQPFNSPAYGVSLLPRLATSGGAGLFYGLNIPALHTNILTVGRGGTLEFVQVTAYDLELPRVPVALAVGPTYIREERQVVGVFRIRTRAAGHGHSPQDSVEVLDGDVSRGTSSSSAHVSPTIELSTESRDARLRHARFRVDAHYEAAFVSDDHASQKVFRVAAGAEGTVFRSRFFSESFASNGTAPRGAAWGVGGGVVTELDLRWVSFGIDALTGVNRPELLSLMPSAADQPELRLVGSLRVEN